jgi:glycosyltransferase involved in cell wall biosynthesis
VTAVVYAATAGVGGLGLQAATAIAGLTTSGSVVALGPGSAPCWLYDASSAEKLRWEAAPIRNGSWFTHHVLRRLTPGQFSLIHDLAIAKWAADRVATLKPDRVYAFTQVGLEALQWAKAAGVPTVLDNPNGHIVGFREVYLREANRWGGWPYLGHPTRRMVQRVEEEYALADRIRVSSAWAKQSMISRGVPADKISVIPQVIDLSRFTPPVNRPPASGPLRVCYVGSLDLRKGFVYLLRAVRAIRNVSLHIVGATGDRASRRLFAREQAGLSVSAVPGDPVPAYHAAELFVLPSLEDGFGFVVAEAMACGLPVVVTDQCGAAELVSPGKTGWVVPAGDSDALAAAIADALAHRADLAEMGRAARATVERRMGIDNLKMLAEWVLCTPSQPEYE